MTSALFIYLSWQIIKPAGEKNTDLHWSTDLIHIYRRGLYAFTTQLTKYILRTFC